MHRSVILLLSTMLIVTTAYAGGSIFGGGKHKRAYNPYGVNSINVHVCGSLECPPVRIVEGACDGERMSLHWGVCLCDEGYIAKNGTCVEEPKQTIDGWTGDENDNCDIKDKKGICSVCLSIENTVGTKGKDEFWADSNALCEGNEVCSKGGCQTVPGSGCVKNSDCTNKKTLGGDECGVDGCYCNYGNSYTDLSYPSTTGTCALNNDYVEFFYGDSNERRIAVKTEYDIWSSKNFCESLNMRLMGWNELNCIVEGGKVTLNSSEGTHLMKAGRVIYPTSVSVFYGVAGYDEDYSLIKIVRTMSELYLPGNTFFFCR